MRQRPRGRSFKITERDVKSYGYAKPRRAQRYARNPGVTTIAAINGRGAYSARSSMRGLGRTARVNRARKALTAAQRRAAAKKFGAAKRHSSNRRTRKPVSPAVARRQFKQTWGYERGSRAHKRALKRLEGGDLTPLFRGPKKKSRRAKSAGKSRKTTGRTTTMRTRTRRKSAHRKHPRVKRRRSRAAKAPVVRRRRRKAHRKNRGTSAGARKGWRTRRAHARKAPARRRTHRRRHAGKKLGLHARRVRAGKKAARTRARNRVARSMEASMKRGHLNNPRRRRRSRRHRRNAMVENRRTRRVRRRPVARRRVRRNRRHTRRAAPSRRRHRRNRRSLAANSRRRRTHRRHRRNSRRRSYRRNASSVLLNTLKIGGLVAIGLVAEKLLGGIVRDQILARITGAPATATPPAAAGLEALQPYNGLLGSAIATAGGALLVNKLVKNAETRNLLTAGLGAGFVHTLLMFALDKLGQPTLVSALSGDGTAVKLSAMYGMGAASIMPRYAPIGEYFSAQAGVGEYFQSGVGAYEHNPDLYQAAAGMGAQDAGNTNHIDPSSNLDRELSIAEAAAGVGALQPYEASAGIGEYFASGVSGLGAVSTVPSSSTWIPGSSNPQLWAGTRAVSNRQSASEMVPAGVLETGGGQGIFG